MLAEPIRAAPATAELAMAAEPGFSPIPALVPGENPMLDQINAILDERIRPGLAGDGGGIEIIGLNEKRLTIRYQGACGSCPSSFTGTLMAIESILQSEVDPELEVISV